MRSRATIRPRFLIPWLAILLIAGVSHFVLNVSAEEKPPVDATTLHGKVMCGYQGWFRCPGDGSKREWLHWSKRTPVTPFSVTFQMWPDLTEFPTDQKYPVPGFTHKDGSPAYLFSSADESTVRRHFQWMQEYGIDGVFLQRFLVNLHDPSFDKVLSHVRSAAKDSGRTFAICYDLTGFPSEQIFDRLKRDWQELCDESKVTRDERYLDHDGLPVVFLWGLYPDRFDANLAHRLIDFFHEKGPYRATVVGGVPNNWRQTTDEGWKSAFAKLDVISPWNVGNIEIRDGVKVANTNIWKEDLAALSGSKTEFLPVIYPGFDWTNLKGIQARKDIIDRRRGDFYWEQWVAAAKLKTGMVYVAMFDEVDEATAIFKVTNNPPTQAEFDTLDGLRSDWYLQLTGEGGRMIRGEREIAPKIPITAVGP